MDRAALQSALRDAEALASELAERFQPAAFYLAAKELIQNDAGAATEPSAGSLAAPSRGLLPATVIELLAVLARKSHLDRFEGLAFYALNRDGIDGISTEYIASSYSNGRMPAPRNPADVIGQCVRRGHLMVGGKEGSQKTWRLTATGERHVVEMLEETAGQ